MDWQLLGRHEDGADYVLIFETGDPLMDGLERFAEDREVSAGTLFALGAFRNATLAYFAWESKDYEELVVDEQVEVVSLTGDIGREDGKVSLHVHAVLGKRNGNRVAPPIRRSSGRSAMGYLSPGRVVRDGTGGWSARCCGPSKSST